MKIAFAVTGVLVVGGLFVWAQVASAKTNLKVGDLAPDFTLSSTSGTDFTLSDFRGKKNVVLAFFPKAFTSGCTREMTAYQAGIGEFNGIQAQVVSISTDNLDTLKRWSTELKASFPMLSDANHKVSKEYGVLAGVLGYANRTTFVIDTEGRIQQIEEGSAALGPTGAATACKRMSRKP
ncbi:MAG: peroxiredoxin [Acidobacteriales bacterium]|nr:peroxiredoxin [Terriglobales bacterium]